MRRMGLFVLGVAAIIAGSGALAGPFDDSVLRGPANASYDGSAVQPRFVTPIKQRWEGLYLGAHAGYAGAGTDFGNGTASLVDYILRNDVVGPHVSGWTALPKTDNSKPVFGGFIGYSYQSDELVFGLEGNYNRVASGGLYASASDSMTRTFSDDAVAPAQHHYFYTATVSSSASARIRDYGTVRARAGFALDRFLPYVFVGGALGRVDTVRSATVAYQRQDIPDTAVPPITPEPTFNFGPQTRAEQKDNAFAYGYAVGLGIDIAVMPNVFMRAEWEYLHFLPVQDIKINLNTARVGLGIKF